MPRHKKVKAISAALRDALRDEARSSGRSPYELASASGVDRSVLSRFLREERTITLDTADRLAGMLGLSLGR